MTELPSIFSGMGGKGSGRRAGTVVRTHESSTDLFAKKCSVCGVEKPLCDFAPHRDGKHKRKAKCRLCEKDEHVRWKTSHRDDYLAMRHKSNDNTLGNRLKRTYGISLAEYEKMREEQGRVCALCGKPEEIADRRGRQQRLSVDHDHTTGKVRGLLCFNCNLWLGKFEKADVEFDRLKVYLERGKSK